MNYLKKEVETNLVNKVLELYEILGAVDLRDTNPNSFVPKTATELSNAQKVYREIQEDTTKQIASQEENLTLLEELVGTEESFKNDLEIIRQLIEQRKKQLSITNEIIEILDTISFQGTVKSKTKSYLS